MISWPHCFGPMVAHLGRSMWYSKATHFMTGTQKEERGRVWGPMIPSKGMPWETRRPPQSGSTLWSFHPHTRAMGGEAASNTWACGGTRKTQSTAGSIDFKAQKQKVIRLWPLSCTASITVKIAMDSNIVVFVTAWPYTPICPSYHTHFKITPQGTIFFMSVVSSGAHSTASLSAYCVTDTHLASTETMVKMHS